MVFWVIRSQRVRCVAHENEQIPRECVYTCCVCIRVVYVSVYVRISYMFAHIHLYICMYYSLLNRIL